MTICDECGASLAGVESCLEHFHALLLLESEIPGGPGEVPHFHAVASYGVQHPRSMGYTADTLTALVDAMRDVVSGAADLSDVRRRVRFHAAQTGRVTRRQGDAVPAWSVAAWNMTVVDVLARGARGYSESVEAWSHSIVESIGNRRPVLSER